MGIWGMNDLLYALCMAVISAIIHHAVPRLKKWMAEDKTMSDREAKLGECGLTILRWTGYATAALSLGTLVLPLLDAVVNSFLGKVVDLINQYIGFVIIAVAVYIWLKNRKPKKAKTPIIVDDFDIELTRQAALDLQPHAMNFMLRVLIALSSFTPIIRPRDTHDIEIRSTDGASFYLKGNVVIYQAEAEVEGEITPEIEDTLQREAQRYAQKYIAEYPMLISPEAGGRAPVEVLSVKNYGSRVIIDYVFTSAKSFDLIDARRRARIERQMKQEKPRPYVDEDYGE